MGIAIFLIIALCFFLKLPIPLWAIALAILVAALTVFKKNGFASAFKRAIDLNDNGKEYFGKISYVTPLGDRRDNATITVYRDGAIDNIRVSVPVEWQYRANDYVKVIIANDCSRIKGTVSKKEMPIEIKDALDSAVGRWEG